MLRQRLRSLRIPLAAAGGVGCAVAAMWYISTVHTERMRGFDPLFLLCLIVVLVSIVPLGCLLLLLLGFCVSRACHALSPQRRSYRWAEGRCSKCGYDLRATPDRCPECGTKVHPNPPGPLAREALLQRASLLQDFFEGGSEDDSPGSGDDAVTDWCKKNVWYCKKFQQCLQSSPLDVRRCHRLGQAARRRFRFDHPDALATLGADLMKLANQNGPFPVPLPEKPVGANSC